MKLHAALSRLLVAAVAATSVVVIAPGSPSRADVAAPAWWNGKICDADNYPGSYELGAAYNGVKACGPGPTQSGTDHLVRFFPGAWGQYEWECVELVMRYMYLVYGIHPYGANGDKVVGNYSGSRLTKVVNNGGGLPSPGDIVSMSSVHTAVVTSVSVANGSGTVTIMQQNSSANGWGSLPVTNNVLGGNVTGWLHDPNGGPAGTGSPRVLVSDSSGNLSAKEGALNGSWMLINQGVVDYRASSNRIAILDANGYLWVKEGPLSVVWQQVASGVSPGRFDVTDDMVAVLWGTDLYTKVGSLGATWGLTLNPVQSFKVSAADHIAAVLTGGQLLVQWGSVGTGWVHVTSGVTDYRINDNTVAILAGTDLLVKHGSVGAPWSLILNPVTGVEISPGDHVAATMSSGDLNVQWGAIGSGWTAVTSGNISARITDNRVGILQGGTLSIKEGGVGATWNTVATGATSFLLT